ncbi:MAG: hypothetical protein U0J41_06170, partial [Slackia isoflavoniconvertens]|nr:hypothetical protein [Slackia isoflavoniconvertens]
AKNCSTTLPFFIPHRETSDYLTPRDTFSESEGACEYKEINRRRAVAGMRMHEYLQQAAKLLCPFA